LALYENKKQRTEAMQQQWKHLKCWAQKGKLDWLFPRQPSGSYEAWYAGLRALLNHPKTKVVMAYKEAQRERLNKPEESIIDSMKEQDIGGAATSDLKSWMQDTLNLADTNVHRSRKHRQDAEAAAIERGEQYVVPHAPLPQVQLMSDAAEPGAQPEADTAQEREREQMSAELEVVREEIAPEFLIVWSEAANGEIIGDLT
jgi:hypothetical protein